MAIFEAIGDAIIDYVFIRVFYWPGWALLRAITLGRYPRGLRGVEHNEGFVALIGLITFIIPYLAYLLA